MKTIHDLLSFSSTVQKISTGSALEEEHFIQHKHEESTLEALLASCLTGRPLLIVGEPGIGKSQVALAAAHLLQVPYYSYVIDERTDRDDVLFRYDAISRLGEAQMLGALQGCGVLQDNNQNTKGGAEALKEIKELLREDLDPAKFIFPGAMWWAFDPDGAEKVEREAVARLGLEYQDEHKSVFQRSYDGFKEDPTDCEVGSVVLIDEIDKADISVPNGLLECLSERQFRVPQINKVVKLKNHKKPPLIIFTSNRERDLPPAFIRRCVVHNMNTMDEEAERKNFLMDRARAWFDASVIDDKTVGDCIDRLIASREKAGEKSLYKPGASEFLDLLRILASDKYSGKAGEQEDVVKSLSKFTFDKYKISES